MQITFPFDPVRALLHLAGKTDICKHINGVWLDFQGPTIIVWATNGVVAGAYRTEEPSVDASPVFLPREVVESLARGPRIRGVSATVTIDGDQRAVELLGQSTRWTDAGHTPVDWRVPMAMPRSTSGEAAQFNLSQLLLFIKCREVLRGGKTDATMAGVFVSHNGSSAARVTLANVVEFIGAAMPIGRWESAGPAGDLPPWVLATRPAAEPAPAPEAFAELA